MTTVDVAVVGAGLSGLAAAHLLTKAGARVEVLEARDRLGGRLDTIELAGAPFDVGGQWIGPGQSRIAALAAAMDIPTFPTPTGGRTVVEVAGRRTHATGTIPRLPILSLFQLQRTIWTIERTARKVPPIGAAGRARHHDHRSLADWMDDRGLRDDVRGVITAALRVVLGREPDETSFLQLLQYVRSAGSLMPLVEVESGAQETRFTRGAAELATRVSGRLDQPVRTGCAVRGVHQDKEVVELEHDGGTTRAGAAIVAVPPDLVTEIDFDPVLPDDRRNWLGGSTMGTTVKALAVYERPFWRDTGMSGEAVSDDGPLSVVFDNTSADGVPCLVGFGVAGPGRRLAAMDADQRRGAVLDHLAHLLGPAARSPSAYADRDWGVEPWSRGCPVALPDLGVTATTAIDPREPHGRVHWAGTEVATEWRGFMEGAIESGQRAAREVVGELGDRW